MNVNNEYIGDSTDVEKPKEEQDASSRGVDLDLGTVVEVDLSEDTNQINRNVFDNKVWKVEGCELNIHEDSDRSFSIRGKYNDLYILFANEHAFYFGEDSTLGEKIHLLRQTVRLYNVIMNEKPRKAYWA